MVGRPDRLAAAAAFANHLPFFSSPIHVDPNTLDPRTPNLHEFLERRAAREMRGKRYFNSKGFPLTSPLV